MASRSLLRALMGKRATQSQNVPTADANGGPVANWTVVASNLPCAVWPTQSMPDVAAAFARRDIVTEYVLCFDTDRAAKASDKFVVAGDAGVYVTVGSMKYEEPALIPGPLYLVAANLRTN